LRSHSSTREGSPWRTSSTTFPDNNRTIVPQRTAQNAGWQVDLRVIRYDGGLWTINGKRIGKASEAGAVLAVVVRALDALPHTRGPTTD
jgi:hypothetical protein